MYVCTYIHIYIYLFICFLFIYLRIYLFMYLYVYLFSLTSILLGITTNHYDSYDNDDYVYTPSLSTEPEENVQDE